MTDQTKALTIGDLAAGMPFDLGAYVPLPKMQVHVVSSLILEQMEMALNWRERLAEAQAAGKGSDYLEYRRTVIRLNTVAPGINFAYQDTIGGPHLYYMPSPDVNELVARVRLTVRSASGSADSRPPMLLKELVPDPAGDLNLSRGQVLRLLRFALYLTGRVEEFAVGRDVRTDEPAFVAWEPGYSPLRLMTLLQHTLDGAVRLRL